MTDLTSGLNRGYPADAVAYITVTLSDGTAIQGSGAFISPNEVLTAAHLLPSNAVSVSVDPGRVGNDRPFGYDYAASWTAEEDLTGKNTLTPQQSASDLGVIVLPDNLGDQTGWFTVANSIPGYVNVSGYPDTDTGVEQTAPLGVTADPTPNLLDYPAGSTAPGSSGGPIWYQIADPYHGSPAYVVGAISTDEYGPRLTGSNYQWVEQQIAAHAQPVQVAASTFDYAANPSAVAFNLDSSTVEDGAGTPAPIYDAGPITGTSHGDTILAGPNEGAWDFVGEGGHTTINWESDVGYQAASLSSDGGGGLLVSADGTTIDINGLSEMHFIDGDLQGDPSSTAAQVLRVYLAATGAAPSPHDQGYWTDQIDSQGGSLDDLATSLQGGAAYASRFGADQSDTDFVNALYQNILGRPADAGGLAQYSSALAGGYSRAEILVDFANSGEFQSDTASQVGAGIWSPDPLATSVARLYYSAFDRAPDLPGFIVNVQAVYGATSLNQLADDFAGSAEFLGKYGSTSNQQYVDLLYQNTLGRAPDAAGEQLWLGALNAGYSRGYVLLGFSDSAEHIADLSNVVDKAGVVFA